MKRLIGVLAILMLAVGAFAVDISAGIRLGGDLINYDGNNIDFLSLSNQTGEWDFPFQFSISGEKAGGSIKLWPGADLGGRSWNGVLGGFNIWFKPVDALTINVGNVGMGINEEQIDWWRSDAKSGDFFSYSLNLNLNGFFAGVVLGAEDGWMFKSADDDPDTVGVDESENDGNLAPIYFQAGYGADFGTIAGFFRYKEDDMKFGVGYNNTFGNTYAFVNAIFYMKDEFDKVRVELYAAPAFDPVAFKLWVPVDLDINNGDDDNVITVGTILRADLNLGMAVTPYARVDVGDWLADSFAMTIQPGLIGHVGSMEWDVGLKFNIADPFTFSVPVIFKLGF